MNQNQKEIKPFTRIDALSETLTRNIEIIQKQIFFIIDFQICYKTDEYTIPIEISIKPFLGLRIPDVIESFHQILNQQIPIQCYLNSKHYSDFEHGITPQTIKKDIRDIIKATMVAEIEEKYEIEKDGSIEDIINKLTDEMLKYASEMEFEKAAELRDRIKELENLK